MMRYKVRCNYVQGRWAGKQIVPVSDTYETYETIVAVYNEDRIFGVLLSEILKKTNLKCVKVVNITYTLL